MIRLLEPIVFLGRIPFRLEKVEVGSKGVPKTMRSQSIDTESGPVIRLDTPDLLKRARYELSRHNPVTLRVGGTTMRPSIEDGDLVTIVPVNSHNIHPGDIVLYQSLSDTALVHRVLKLEHRSTGKFVVTRGDASSANNTPVPIHHVMGRVACVRRDGQMIEILPESTNFLGRIRTFFYKLFDRNRDRR